MSLVTVARYQAITGDTATAAATVSARLDEAVAVLADDLGRPLVEAERTETMWPDRIGWVYPLAVPIVAVTDWTIRGNALRSGPPGCSPADPVEVTYTGGYAERTASPSAVNALPVHIERDLAWAAYALGHADELLTGIPAGATAVSVGDISVSFGAGGVTGSVDDLAIRWSRVTRRHARRSI